MNGEKIMQKQRDLHETQYDFELQKITLINLKSKKKKERKAKRYIKQMSKDIYRSLFVFLKPTEIRGTGLLNWQNEDRDADQWIYLPVRKKMQRIAGSGKKRYFMGTDFTYEDLEIEKIKDYSYQCTEEKECGKKKKCYIVKAIAKNNRVTEVIKKYKKKQ